MTDLEDFRRHLESQNLKRATVMRYIGYARRFLKACGDKPVSRIGEREVGAYFAKLKDPTRPHAAVAVTAYLKFAAASLPVVVVKAGAASLPPPTHKPTKKELALREKWTVDKLRAEKEAADALITQLARKVIDHYLYFQGRMRGEPENLDDVYRFADECRELIEKNLALFMGLSAQGRNVHSVIDERMQRL